MPDSTQDPRTGGGDPGIDTATQQQAAEDDVGLRESLASLSRILLGQQGLAAALAHVAEFTVRAIPGADGAGLTLLDNHRQDTVVASAEFVRQVDALQYGVGEGPSISAAEVGRTIRSGSLGADQRWPRFGPRAGRLGVRSVLSLPLLDAESVVIGALNVYAHARDVFDERAVELGELFAVPASVSVQTAQQLDYARRLAAQFETALASREIIDQAIGIVMSRSGCTSDEAFTTLRGISQSEHRKLSEVALHVRDEAVRRARARHRDD